MQILGLYDRGYIINFVEGDQALYRTPILYYPSVNDVFHSVTEDDTLYRIAFKYYRSSYLWYLIADANPEVEDIFELEVGTTLVIPDITVM